jgi:hypothetical protein
MNNYIRCLYRIILTIILSALLAGCTGYSSVPTPTPSPNQIDKSPFTGIPCAAPCWHGLVIGKSSESEVRSTLSTLTYIDQKSIEYVPQASVRGPDPNVIYPGLLIYASCCLIIEVADHVLNQIDILLNYQISAGEVIADLGPPDYVGSQLMGAETLTCQVELIWYSKQLVLNSVPESYDSSNPEDKCVIVQNTHKIPSNLTISGVSYMLIPWIERVLTGDGSEFYKFTGTIPEK